MTDTSTSQLLTQLEARVGELERMLKAPPKSKEASRTGLLETTHKVAQDLKKIEEENEPLSSFFSKCTPPPPSPPPPYLPLPPLPPSLSLSPFTFSLASVPPSSPLIFFILYISLNGSRARCWGEYRFISSSLLLPAQFFIFPSHSSHALFFSIQGAK